MDAIDFEGHQDRVRRLSVAKIMALSVALLDESERVVQLDRRLVPRKDVQFELRHLVLARPRDGGLEESAADAAAPRSRVDHQSEIRDVAACRVLIARER